MKSVNQLSKTAMSLGIAIIAMATMDQPAQAFNFQQGDLILAVYGNRTPGEGKEVLINLSDLTPTGQPGPIGNMDVLTNPAQTYTFDLSAYVNAPGVVDTNPADPAYPVRYTVMGFQPDAGTGGFTGLAGSSTNLTGTVQASIGNFPNGLAGWSGNVNDGNAPNLIMGQNGAVLDFTNTNSHSSRTGVAERLFNAFSVPMASNFDQLLHLIAGDSELVDNPVVFRGQALLASNGTFQITGGMLAPIPVPAAVVLFGSGLIGLIGIARRNRSGATA
jgi:hypothetical protein